MGRIKYIPRPATRHFDDRYSNYSAGLQAILYGLLLCLLPFQSAAGQPLDSNAAIINNSASSPGSGGTPDWQGLKRDTWYFVGAQVASLGVLYALPESVSNWSEEQKDNFSLEKWRENVSDPHLDKDDFYLNYILHPYWGATYYVRARERGYGRLDSFWYSAFLSTLYEVGPEALFEQPSIQDLIITPVFGAWLGEYFMGIRNAVRERASARGYRTRGETWTWYLTDPLALINGGVSRLLGQQASLSFRPLIGVTPALLQIRETTSLWVPGPGARGRVRLPALAAGYPFRRLAGQLSGNPAGPAYLPDGLGNPLYQFQTGSRPGSGQGTAGISITLSW
ncbi:MAG: DUF3943 domain-containing protein [Gammaproteobacteria bacterium]|jgi:hypothetical protein